VDSGRGGLLDGFLPMSLSPNGRMRGMRPFGGWRIGCCMRAWASLHRSCGTRFGMYSRVVQSSSDPSRNDHTPVSRLCDALQASSKTSPSKGVTGCGPSLRKGKEEPQ
jgi:hypothetical protein